MVVAAAGGPGAEVEVTVSDTGHRHRRGRAGADLRGVPARRPRCPKEHRGHRPGADAVKADHRAARGAAVGRERGRRRQHLRVHDPDPAGRRAAAGPEPAGGRRSPITPTRAGRVLVVEDDPARPSLLTLYLEGAPATRWRSPATASRALTRPRGSSRPPSSWTSCCRPWTAGRARAAEGAIRRHRRSRW